ncbi:MAG: nucleotidyltransferase domain-containing protein [Candidatus Hydrogenedentes bacterium]|nr:nucleotidyltransferase domain-containing protein [Candidatus Hydrogenedentota bacterium]
MSASIEDTLLQRIVGRTVEAVRPLRVVLFGSAARGEMNENSDVDLLLVMPDGTHRRDTARKVYRALGGLGVSKDIIVVTEDDLRRFGDEPSLVIYPALREGKEIYSAG